MSVTGDIPSFKVDALRISDRNRPRRFCLLLPPEGKSRAGPRARREKRKNFHRWKPFSISYNFLILSETLARSIVSYFFMSMSDLILFMIS